MRTGLLALAAMLVPAGLRAATFYVGPDGDDANPGTETEPFRTIQQAADTVDPGDTVIVKDGVYLDEDASNTVVDTHRGGTAQDWVTFRSEHRWGAVIDGQDNTTGYCWNFSATGSYVHVEGFDVRGCSSGGFWSNSGASHVVMKGNHVHDIGILESTSEYGICGVFEGNEASYHVYDSNVFHDIGRTGPPDQNFNHDHAIYNCGDHTTIVNNLFYDLNAGWGVHMAGYELVEDVVVSNNFFAWGNVRGQLILWLGCHDITIQNNLFFEPAVESAINFLSDDLQNIVIRNNLVFGGALKDADDLGVPVVTDNIVGEDPLLADPETHDFHILAGSPAADMGYAEGSPAYDHDGNTRPDGAGIDIGAYELVVAGGGAGGGAAGGQAGMGATGPGGASSGGGTAGTAGAGNGAVGGGASAAVDDDAGCGCAVIGRLSARAALWPWGLLGLVALRARRWTASRSHHRAPVMAALAAAVRRRVGWVEISLPRDQPSGREARNLSAL
jgi:hypothetical protein